MRAFAILFLSAVVVCMSSPLLADEAHSMTGCLARGDADGSFVLNDVEGAGTVVIAQSSADLSGHVGHKIEITGTTSESAAGAAVHAMNVTAMKHLAATCP